MFDRLNTVLARFTGPRTSAIAPTPSALRIQARGLLALAQAAIVSGNWAEGGAYDPDQAIHRLEAALASATTTDAELAPLALDLVDCAIPAATGGEWAIDRDSLGAVFDVSALASTFISSNDDAPPTAIAV